MAWLCYDTNYESLLLLLLDVTLLYCIFVYCLCMVADICALSCLSSVHVSSVCFEFFFLICVRLVCIDCCFNAFRQERLEQLAEKFERKVCV